MMTFRFYSLQWRTWGACFLQVAWRRYCKRKHDKSLREAEDCKMLWQMKLIPHLVLVLLFMHQGLLQMHFELCDKILHTKPECHKDCYHCCYRSLLSQILLLIIVSSMVFQVNYNVSLCFTYKVHMAVFSVYSTSNMY